MGVICGLFDFRSRGAGGSLQFDLCRRDYRQTFVVGLDYSREFHGFGFPALMDKLSCERRLSTEFPYDPVLVPEISDWHSDLGAFFSLGDRGDLEMFLQNLPAPLMNNPGGCSDLRIVVRGELLHQKIH